MCAALPGPVPAERARVLQSDSPVHGHGITLDGNEATALVAYRLSEVIAIYPITPASAMGELADAWATAEKPNLWGLVPDVIEMQSEAGAAGAVHGALLAGSLATTFTSSQGLLLMVPNLYKIAGELTPCVIHVAARAIATHALSIFGDHSDVMAVRQTGWALLGAASVQEAHDFALVAHAATLRARVPFLHFFDGFRTSHEINQVVPLADSVLASMIPDELILAHRGRALSPERPVLRGSAQNPDVYFQAREAVNPFYGEVPGIVEDCFEELNRHTGRRYKLFDYTGHPDADRVIVIMGSGGETVIETVGTLARLGQKVGVIQVRLFRPFSATHLLAALPATVRSVAVLDRTKEPGAIAEPLFQDVATALFEAGRGVRLIGGRYGLASKEFTPAMVKAVFDELARPEPKRRFTVGIVDDVERLSLDYDSAFDREVEPNDEIRALFFGLGSDGTVGANKDAVKIVGQYTPSYAQGYFVYDSKKSGSMTVSHLRFSPRPVRRPYLVQNASFIGIHHDSFLERDDLLDAAEPGSGLLLNLPDPAESVWARLPARWQRIVHERDIEVYVVDAAGVARAAGLGNRINTIMMTCFFAVSGVLPEKEAMAKIKESIQKTYGGKGRVVVERNVAAVDTALAHLFKVPRGPIGAIKPSVPGRPLPDFVRRVTEQLMLGRGDLLPVSAMPVDGTFPTGTSRFERRNISPEIPEWVPELCIQCGKCGLVCPHAAIQIKAYPGAPDPRGFLSVPYKGKELPEGTRLTIQTAPEDCTGCTLCVEVCPAKDKRNVSRKAVNMVPKAPVLDAQKQHWAHFLELPSVDRTAVRRNTVKGSQLLEPLFLTSGACSGCGETPYLKLVTQLFGDRMIVANATGCSSIYGGNLPTTPWASNKEGRGPAWANSLFEDNAEFGLGIRVAADNRRALAAHLLEQLAPELGESFVNELLTWSFTDDASVAGQRKRIEDLDARLEKIDLPAARRLKPLTSDLVDRSVWIVGGDGWAYDIGYGGLDHVIASGKNVNILVLDTEVYSNTGGQASKATPKGAIAKFASSGKTSPKKDLAMLALAYENVYVARIAFGADDRQTLETLLEAESYPGPSIVVAYSHCIAHGIPMHKGLEQQSLAVESGHWPLFRFDPRKLDAGKNPMSIDSKEPTVAFETYAYNEGRYKMLTRIKPKLAKHVMEEADHDAKQRFRTYDSIRRTYEQLLSKETR
ncbi:MAG: pyruvate:ferredoxin (flavodoxin) oxidoreductase [Deltaproteobacteria bacterium]|nr:pyruvate:ferredoxin (flavodoxin) oxidoreductase [Deltaproteobacteria bacterium]